MKRKDRNFGNIQKKRRELRVIQIEVFLAYLNVIRTDNSPFSRAIYMYGAYKNKGISILTGITKYIFSLKAGIMTVIDMLTALTARCMQLIP